MPFKRTRTPVVVPNRAAMADSVSPLLTRYVSPDVVGSVLRRTTAPRRRARRTGSRVARSSPADPFPRVPGLAGGRWRVRRRLRRWPPHCSPRPMLLRSRPWLDNGSRITGWPRQEDGDEGDGQHRDERGLAGRTVGSQGGQPQVELSVVENHRGHARKWARVPCPTGRGMADHCGAVRGAIDVAIDQAQPTLLFGGQRHRGRHRRAAVVANGSSAPPGAIDRGQVRAEDGQAGRS